MRAESSSEDSASEDSEGSGTLSHRDIGTLGATYSQHEPSRPRPLLTEATQEEASLSDSSDSSDSRDAGQTGDQESDSDPDDSDAPLARLTGP